MPLRIARLLCALLFVTACAAPIAGPTDSLDLAAQDYVRLQMAIGEKEDGYIDAFYGPETLKAEGQAIAAAEGLPQLAARVDALSARIGALSAGATGDTARRTRFLLAQLHAARTRLRMLQGEKLSFEDEALGLFGVRPVLQPLASFDPLLAEIDRLVPGSGPLADRVTAYQSRFVIPATSLEAVFAAAIAECRARSNRYIPLPADEKFDMRFVTGKSWSGYNYYLGNHSSRIEINTDLPIQISRAVDLGCHEGYPGHHALNVSLEQKLVRERGWVEYSVYPLYSPQSLIAEGTANYGVELAFPGEEKVAFETRVLYPLAGLPAREAARYDRLLDALDTLKGARLTIARELLEGRIDEAEAIRLTQKYQLASEGRAKQLTQFTKEYRSYVINYGLGEDLVGADVASRPTQAARWARFADIISEPTLPSDLRSAN